MRFPKLLFALTLVSAITLNSCTTQQPTSSTTSSVKESASVDIPSSCSHGAPIAYTGSTVQKVSEIARAVTVCITSQTPGSGVIIKRHGNVYTVLTAAHVVATEDKYKLVAPDGNQYAVEYSKIKRFPDKIDLAILQFTSDKDYRVVEIGDSQKAVIGTPSYVAGFPLQSAESTIQNYRFSDGQISANAVHPLEKGYALAYYNDTFSGMSGGPVLDEQGKLIGIHGQSKVRNNLIENKGINPETGDKRGLSLAIPIYTFLSLITQVEPVLEFQPVAAVAVSTQQTADDFFLQGLDKIIVGDQQGAIADYDQAIRLNPNYADAYFKRGYARSVIHKFDVREKIQAIVDYDQAIRLNPNYADVYNERGINRSALGDKQGAIADYDQAIRLNPNYASAYYNRGIDRFDLGDKQGAIADYDQAIRLNPNYASAYYNRGVARSALGDKKGAIADYDQAIRLNPNDADAYYNRGNARSALGDKKGAITDYGQAIRLNPNDAQAFGTRGLARSALGDNKGAISDLQKAADLYQAQGDRDGYQRVISLLNQISR
ncbi:tetratricopeptide repeat-containing serine protease family protein [Pseudanabaena sp. PCC 6802]|uniref:tetratricopeptide repeat-containing S1 family peptidase n=1 Tax=Pseudanabaena sp. PCC 6802 TaxID=118173 RepID=UPI00037F332A|nr:tetratricopeptide repeat-containing serine protease family protein [Pseudanabaena sp. PCC 6802]